MAITLDARDLNARRGSSPRGAMADDARARAFRQARRHSRLVRLLRFGLPTTAILFTAYFALTFGISWQLGPGRLKVKDIEVTADDLTMKGPSYFGVTKDGGRYEVRAQKAVVAFNRDAPIKLIDIDGDLVQANNVTTSLKAKHGLYDNTKSELELYDGIDIKGSNGLTARLSRAMVYSKEHRIVSNHPVDVLMPTGTVRGASMTMRTDTKETNFVGNVRVHLVSAGQQAGASKSATPVTPAFGRDSRQPVDVTSEKLYVNDTTKTALFTGNVVAVQGDSTLRSPELHVSYEGKAAADMVMAGPQQPGEESSRLSRLVAKNGAVVTIGIDRRVAGDEADFDAKADTALFTGNVLVNQLRNVLQGRRLFIDRKTGKTRLESPAEAGKQPGRIAATFYQNSDGKAQTPQPKPKPTALADAAGGVFGSFKTDPNAPIDVEADTLDVHDQEKQAIFRGNVKSQQGDFVVRTVEMAVFYTGQGGFAMTGGGEDAAAKTPSQMTKVEARQKVLITSKDGQTATGDWAIFDVKANTVLMGDRVVVSRGKDVAEGPRLKIDLNTGMYRYELESETVAAQSPATSAAPAFTGDPVAVLGAQSPTGRACPPGKQCLLFYPKEAQEKAKEVIKKVLPDGAKKDNGWEPSTSASPVLRSN
jgi:LPS export ABC transporter protein LptC/lipopolysaccharide transport protein LptA